MQTDPIGNEELDRRIIPPSEFVADASAFIDVRLPDSQGKHNFSFIGPGVSQNPDQHVNVRDPHGFNIGAAGLPPGTVNNQHLHFTAEVFVSIGTDVEFNVDVDSDRQFPASGRFVFSLPTWMFRGFRNVGEDYALLYAVLGEDDTGGILWSPKVLHQAADTGLYLRSDDTLLDTTAGDVLEGVDIVPPMSEDDLGSLRAVKSEELSGRLIKEDDMVWSDRALLDSVLPDRASRLAPVIGWGMTMDRNHVPPISNPHSFTLEWLAVPPGNRVSAHRHSDQQALIVATDGWELEVNLGDDALSRPLEKGAVVSLPAGAWRSFINIGAEDAVMCVVNGGDTRTKLEWPAETIEAARRDDWAVDASGYLAPFHLIERTSKPIV
ncbi:MAG: cupin domain-containing protein [Acidobacteria bacterium]|nr:MAG: cupin domain-containing protein [Acidobacteriota bacterium]